MKVNTSRGYTTSDAQRITTKEARKLLGKHYADLTDDQIEHIVSLLDFIAKDIIQSSVPKHKSNTL